MGGLINMIVFAWMVTNGTWNFLPQPSFATGFYDAQARALLAGHWWMSAKLLSVEGIRIGRHSYMYFGPVPAILRIPVLLVTHRLDGRLTPISILIALAVALIFLSRLAWRVRSLFTDKVVTRAEALATMGVIVILGVGSAFLFQASSPAVYEEAEVWSLAFALGAFDFLLAFLMRPTRGSVLLAGLSATLALLTRAAVGIGPIAALAILACFHLFFAVRRRTAPSALPGRLERRLALIGAPADRGSQTRAATLWSCVLVPLALYAAVNEERFHTLFSIPYKDQGTVNIDPAYRAAVAHSGGSLQGAKFFLTDLVTYFRPDALHFIGLFPWIDFTALPTPSGHLYYAGLKSTSSVSATMPALVVLALVGLVAVARASFAPSSAIHQSVSPALLVVPIIGAAICSLGVLTFAALAERQIVDLLPIIDLGALTGFYVLVSRARRSRVFDLSLAGGLAVLALFGLWTNMALSLINQRVINPSSMEQQKQFVVLEERLNNDLFGDHPSDVVRSPKRLPPPGLPASLVILGNCAGLYQSSGMAWEPIEQSESTGSYNLLVTLPLLWRDDQYWPLLVNARGRQGDLLTMHPVGKDRVEFAYLLQLDMGMYWYTSSPEAMQPGHSYKLTAVLDPNVGQMAVRMGGTTVFQLPFYDKFGSTVVGHSPVPGPVTATFPGSIRVLPNSTPVCSRILHQLDMAAKG
jgi:hypothetical protein